MGWRIGRERPVTIIRQDLGIQHEVSEYLGISWIRRSSIPGRAAAFISLGVGGYQSTIGPEFLCGWQCNSSLICTVPRAWVIGRRPDHGVGRRGKAIHDADMGR